MNDAMVNGGASGTAHELRRTVSLDRPPSIFPVRLAQLSFKDFPRGIARQCVYEFDSCRLLITRESLSTELNDIVTGQSLAGSGNNDCVDVLSPVIVRNANHRSFEDSWMLAECEFDFGRINILAPPRRSCLSYEKGIQIFEVEGSIKSLLIYSTRRPEIARAMTSCWISLVPSKMV